MKSNPFIGDTFFKENPTKVLGESVVKKGRFGNDMVYVKGDISNIQNIDADPLPPVVVDLYPDSVQASESKQFIIDKVFEVENKKKEVETLQQLRGTTQKQEPAKKYLNNQEVYSYKEIDEMYNGTISREEKEAYYFCNGELNYKLLFDEFTLSEKEFIEKNLICFDLDKKGWVYYYSYISGNVNKKISDLKRDRERYISYIGESQYEKQLDMLMNVKPAPKGFVGNDRIILLPHSNLAKEFMITEFAVTKRELYGETSLFNAFKRWLREIPSDRFDRATSREIIDFYLENKTETISDRLSKEEKAKEEKKQINTKQRAKEEGDRLFAIFIVEELLSEDQARLSYIWNEKFNSIVEPNLSKIPVCFRISKTFKAGKRPLILNPTQRQSVAFYMEKHSGLFAYGVGVGKGHLLTSDILTPDGFKKMGDIKIGDEVIGSNGQPTMVTGVFPLGKIKCYEIIFNDGSSTQVSKDHLWKVQKIKNRENKNDLWHILETEDIINHGLYTNRGDYYYSIPMVQPISFNEKPLAIHPYLLGVLIGDGCLSNEQVCISNVEPDIIEKVKSLLPNSVELRCIDLINKDYRITRKAISGKNDVLTEIKNIGLNVKSNEKFIPKDYLFNSVENRLSLLQGLLDTDGYIRNDSGKKNGRKGCTIIYTTVSEKLANDIVFLVNTFGGTAIIKTKQPTYTYNGEKKTGQLAYNISIRLPKGIVPVSSHKQLSKFVEKTKYQPVRFIADIKEIGEHEAQCISVDAEDHLYVCEDCIVTHNTLASIACASQALDNGLAKHPTFVVPTNTYDKWIGEIQGFTDPKTGIFNDGALPHLPPVVGLFNLNPVIVYEKLKDYSDDDLLIFQSIIDAIEEVKKIESDEISKARMEKINKIYEVNWAGIETEHRLYLESTKAKNPLTYPEFVAAFLKDEYNYYVYTLGKVKSFPDGTIFVLTEVGLQRLGISPENQGELQSSLYYILSQGEKSADKESNRDIAKLQERITERISNSLKNAKLYVEDLGIDFVVFDEAHYYKKLFTYVKGQVTGEGEDYRKGGTKVYREKSKYELKSGQYPSSRALSAYVLSHFVQSQNKNRNVIQLTATPFTNSPLEVYSMLTLTNFKTLSDLGLGNMIDFFDTFMRITWDIKYTPQKTVVKDISLTGYNNLSQLRAIIYSLMDKKDEGANLQRPNKLIYPSVQNGIETTIPMTREQEELMAEVKKYLNGQNEYESICKQAMMDEVEEADFDAVEDEVLIAEWERSTGKEFTGEREALTEKKREELIKAIKSARVEGIEMGEADLSEDESLGVRILKGISMMRQITLSPYLYYKACQKSAGNSKIDMPNYKDYVNSSPKFKYVMGCIASVINYHRSKNEKISGQVIYMNAGVEYFVLLKEYLVKEMNLKENQVGIVSGSMSKTAKENVKNGFLSGEILVLIGSSTISVGVDLQNNATVLYNCYYDWNPTDAAQIEGRIWRQGNRFANVRIVYPQCYNSADPVLFEYLNDKTLRINEIWNRSSTIQELDLRDFNPKELQKKLITDPVEKAEYEILIESEKIEGELIFFENRAESLKSAVDAFRSFKQNREKAISILTTVNTKKAEIARAEAIANQKEKIGEIVDKYSDNPEKMQAEIVKYKNSRYDYENDPDKKFEVPDYAAAGNEKIYADAGKVIDILDDIGWSERKTWGEDLVDKKYEYRSTLIAFRGDYKQVNQAEKQILIPMGLTFDTAENPVQELSAKIDSLKEQLQTIESTKPERVERLKKEAELNAKNIKTVQDRVIEFASRNEELLSKLMILGDNKPAEIVVPRAEEIMDPAADIRLREIEAGKDVVPSAPVFVKTKKAMKERLAELAAKSGDANTFALNLVHLAADFGIDNKSNLFYDVLGLKKGNQQHNKNAISKFYHTEGAKRKQEYDVAKKEAIAEIKTEKALQDVANIEKLALEAEKEFSTLSVHDIIVSSLPKSGELKGITEINVSENGKEVHYGTKVSQTNISVERMDAEEIKNEIEFEKKVLAKSIKDEESFNEDEIWQMKGMTKNEKEDAIKRHKQSILVIDQTKKIIIPFYEKHYELLTANKPTASVPVSKEFTFMADNPMQKARSLQVLEKQIRADGIVMPIYKWIESMPKNLLVEKSKIGSSKSEKGFVEKWTIGDHIIDSKTEVEYYNYLVAGGYPYSSYLQDQAEIKKQAEAASKIEREKANEVYKEKQKQQENESNRIRNNQIKQLLTTGADQIIQQYNTQYQQQIDDLKAKKQTKDTVADIDNLEQRRKDLIGRIKALDNIAHKLYVLVNDEPVRKYDWKAGDEVQVKAYGKDEYIKTVIEEIKEGPFGISYIVKKQDGIANPYMGYDSLFPVEKPASTTDFNKEDWMLTKDEYLQRLKDSNNYPVYDSLWERVRTGDYKQMIKQSLEFHNYIGKNYQRGTKSEFVDAIKEGKITKQQGIKIIESAGLEVPEYIKSLPDSSVKESDDEQKYFHHSAMTLGTTGAEKEHHAKLAAEYYEKVKDNKGIDKRHEEFAKREIIKDSSNKTYSENLDDYVQRHKSAAAPASNMKEIAQKQINAINLSIKYLTGEKLEQAKARLNSLTVSIKYLK